MLDDVKFCKKCGAELFFKMRFLRYSEENGAKVFDILGVCPEKRIYNAHTRQWVRTHSGNRRTYYEHYAKECFKNVSEYE